MDFYCLVVASCPEPIHDAKKGRLDALSLVEVAEQRDCRADTKQEHLPVSNLLEHLNTHHMSLGVYGLTDTGRRLTQGI